MHDREADPDTARDLAQGLAFGATGQDRAALVVVDLAVRLMDCCPTV
ncbi:hypothetical protein [Nocardia fluminea]